MFSGANYTIELRKIHETPGMCVFDFEYDFYEEQFRCEFEQKFIDHYYFDEIGFETVARFKHNLKAHLNKKMPYYRQLYRTELEAENINFLLNKDLRETFLREVDTEDKLTGSNTLNGTDTNVLKGSVTASGSDTDQFNGSVSASGKDIDKVDGSITSSGADTNTVDGTVTNKGITNDHKESVIADGVASASLKAESLTSVSQDTVDTTNKDNTTTTVDYGKKDTTDNTSTTTYGRTDTTDNTSTTTYGRKDTTDSTSTDTTSRTGTNNEDREGKLLEKTELISKGNIGVTSSAELLEKWRSVLINLDEIIIDECRDLFMGIY